MKAKIWLDDLRPPPDETWEWIKTSKQATKEILCGLYSGMTYREISFDHDLGGDDDAYKVAAFIESYAHMGYLRRMTWHIHTANPVGRLRIQAAMMSADRFWDRNEAREYDDPFWFETIGHE